MHGDFRRIALCHFQNAEIGQNEGVDAGIGAESEKIRKRGELRIARQRIAGHVNLYAFRMGAPYALPQLFICKIGRCGAHSERFSRQIDGVRAVIQRRLKALEISGRCEKLRLFYGLVHKFMSPYSFCPRANGAGASYGSRAPSV